MLGVLRHEHGMQAVELRAGDVPVEVVCHQVQRVAVCQEARQAIRNFLAVTVIDSNINRHFFTQTFCHTSFSLSARPCNGANGMLGAPVRLAIAISVYQLGPGLGLYLCPRPCILSRAAGTP